MIILLIIFLIPVRLHYSYDLDVLISCLDCTGVFNLCTDDDKERLGRQAIKFIHEQMDDDKDGLIEASESRDVD